MGTLACIFLEVREESRQLGVSCQSEPVNQQAMNREPCGYFHNPVYRSSLRVGIDGNLREDS
jgi:hypothetical protein